MKRLFFCLLLPLGLLPLGSVPAHAWWPKGHSMLTRAAVQAVPAEVPQWFRDGGDLAAHCAQDPDVQKNRDLPQMTDREYPEHFLDYEMLQGRPLPPTRSAFLKLCAELKIEPSDVGYAPYAVAEWTQRLTMTFAEARKWPQNKNIQTKALVYAGIMSHYAEDLCMPLHVTLSHDGRARPDGSSPKTGIHGKVDSLIEKIGFSTEKLSENQKIEPVASLLPAIEREIQLSRQKIDQTYVLEPLLPPATGPWKAAPEVENFALERGREATRFTAALFLTAWRDAEKTQLPEWLEREAGG